MSILLNNYYNTTEKNDDTSESMSIPRPKRNEAVDREGEEDESGSGSNYKGLCLVV